MYQLGNKMWSWCRRVCTLHRSYPVAFLVMGLCNSRGTGVPCSTFFIYIYCLSNLWIKVWLFNNNLCLNFCFCELSAVQKQHLEQVVVTSHNWPANGHCKLSSCTQCIVMQHVRRRRLLVESHLVLLVIHHIHKRHHLETSYTAKGH